MLMATSPRSTSSGPTALLGQGDAATAAEWHLHEVRYVWWDNRVQLIMPTCVTHPKRAAITPLIRAMHPN
jgi:hypothetical protein